VPDVVVAPVVWLATRLGINNTRTLIFASSLPFIALTSITIVLAYRLTLRWCSDERAAIVAALLFAMHWIPLGFGSTVYPRTLAAACIVAAALIADRWPFAAGALLGLAFADRFSEIVFVAPVLVMITKHRQECLCHTTPRMERAFLRRFNVAQTLLSVLKVILGATVAIILTVGLYDWLTWGTPFSSFLKFAHLTLIAPDFASRVKYQAPWWYLANLVRWCSPLLLPLLWYARRSRAIWFVIIPLIVFSAIEHKELRYLQVMIPFLAIAAAIGFSELSGAHRRIAIALVAASLVWDLYGMRYFARKSQPAVEAAQWLASNPNVHSVAVSQLWAYGDKLYFGDRIGQADLGTPPDGLKGSVAADALALYETDLDVPSRIDRVRQLGYTPVRTFRDDPARAVVVFMKK
jgi:phosphatidylinositol glycan class B